MKCSICKTETDIIHDLAFKIDYHKCPKCQLIQLDQDYRISFSQERVIYDQHENSLDNQGYLNYFIDFLEKGVLPYKKDGALLDFGSGPEPVLIQLINRDYGFQTSHYDLHYAKDKSYQDRSYDVILSTEVIEHVDNPLDFMKHLSSLLKPKGIIALMTLVHDNDTEAFLQWWYRRDQTHITFYSIKTMETLASLVGLKLIYHDRRRIFTFTPL